MGHSCYELGVRMHIDDVILANAEAYALQSLDSDGISGSDNGKQLELASRICRASSYLRSKDYKYDLIFASFLVVFIIARGVHCPFYLQLSTSLAALIATRLVCLEHEQSIGTRLAMSTRRFCQGRNTILGSMGNGKEGGEARENREWQT